MIGTVLLSWVPWWVWLLIIALILLSYLPSDGKSQGSSPQSIGALAPSQGGVIPRASQARTDERRNYVAT
jgi:hypothetical protein